MPEAEDVLIDAAERATEVVRSLWRRRQEPGVARGASLDGTKRRFGFVLRACFGCEWPLVPSDPPPPAGWLARRLGKPAPWEIKPEPTGFTDGTQIFLPRRLEMLGTEAEDRLLLRLMALSLGARLATGSIEICPAPALARDLFWAADGARIDAWLAVELPGLGQEIVAARRTALERRPPLHSLSAAERAVEGIVRVFLAGDAYVAFEAPHAAEWASRVTREPRFAGLYRGMAPVPHWGSPRPDLVCAGERRHDPSLWAAPRAHPLRLRRLARQVDAREVGDEEDSPPGPFFVPFGDPPQSIQDPAGLRRPEDRDEDIDLDTLAEEIERLGRLPRVRSSARVHEALESEIERARSASQTECTAAAEPFGLRYPEWDYRTERYRRAYCAVREVAAAHGDPSWSPRVLEEHRSLLAALRRRFEPLRPRRERRPREREGHDIDLDAFVDDFADRSAGRTPSERLYLAERRLRRDVAVAFLVDASGSTDSWVSGGRTVLEVEKQAALVFCEALESLGDRYGIYAVSGRGARDVRVERAKALEERYGDAVRARIAGFSGSAYTRLGAPIRHLTALLARERSRVRLLLLLSDGKPNDEDEYEGRYGIEDTRQAVAEARLQGLSVFCLTVDREGSAYLPHMFGPHGHAVVAAVAELPLRLPEIYRALTDERV
ncbi:MAG TPA: VWA domain-containing protein [Candidatus Binatia bacterium]|nr:VWA domain-containing protein [Candidatus Binatia bacterium]